MKKVGITGGIGSGKSLVARIFSCLGVPVYNADNRARWLSDHDKTLRDSIIQLLGSRAYNGDQMDRRYVASKVFVNEELLQKLNALIHPAVGRDFENWTESQSAPYVIKEAALMFESGSYRSLDAVIHVTAPPELRISRTLKRDPHRDRKEVESIIARQMKDEERISLSQYELINDERTLLIPQILSLHKTFIQEGI